MDGAIQAGYRAAREVCMESLVLNLLNLFMMVLLTLHGLGYRAVREGCMESLVLNLLNLFMMLFINSPWFRL